MTAPQYYNEFDPYAAQWLRNLIAAGHLPPGDVDERSIVDIQPEDLNGYGQCHFFAGVGVWPYAIGRNDWRERDSLWSGSCPCQPFSAAGQQLGFNDERHLWPAWFHIITQRRPAIVVGEQVSSALAWLDLVRDDLESAGYAVGAADLCAAGYPVENWNESPQHEWLLRALYDCPDPVVAAELLDFAAFAGGNLGAHDGDHIRQRLYFVGLAEPDGWERDGQPSGEGCERNGAATGRHESDGRAQPGGAISRLAYTNGGDASEGRAERERQQRFQSSDNGDGRGRGGGAWVGTVDGLGDPEHAGPQGRGGAERDSLGPGDGWRAGNRYRSSAQRY